MYASAPCISSHRVGMPSIHQRVARQPRNSVCVHAFIFKQATKPSQPTPSAQRREDAVRRDRSDASTAHRRQSGQKTEDKREKNYELPVAALEGTNLYSMDETSGGPTVEELLTA